jgi:hypothetical protein
LLLKDVTFGATRQRDRSWHVHLGPGVTATGLQTWSDVESFIIEMISD